MPTKKRTQKTKGRQPRKKVMPGLKAMVKGMVATLEPRMQTVIRERFGLWGGLPDTLQEIGDRFGVTRERVRQIEVAAMGKLRLTLPSSLEQIVRAKVRKSAVFRQSLMVRALAEHELRQALADDCAEYEASAALSLLQELWCPEESLCQKCMIEAEDKVFTLTDEDKKHYRSLVAKVRCRLKSAGGVIPPEALAEGALAKSVGCAPTGLARVIEVSPQFRILPNGDLALSDKPEYLLPTVQSWREFVGRPDTETSETGASTSD